MLCFLVWFLGCNSDVDIVERSSHATPEVSYQLVPASMDFGTIDLGTSSLSSLQVFNRGEEDFFVEQLSLPPGVKAQMVGIPAVSAGGALEIQLTWTPEDLRLLTEPAVLSLGNGYQTVGVDLPLKGSARGGILTMSSSEHDFGELNIGCQSEFYITLTNTGNEALVLDEVRISGSEAFEMVVPEVPLTLGPFESRQIDITFQPWEPESMVALVELSGDDVHAFSRLTGSGNAEDQNEMSWRVGEASGKMTVIFHVHGFFMGNWGPAYIKYSDYFTESLQTYFEALQSNGANYRMTFIWKEDGTVEGSTRYLDASYTPEESTDIVLEDMLEHAVQWDIDKTWPIFLSAVEEHSDWLFEDKGWEGSKLSFVMISRDQEQSGTPWNTAMTTLQGYKEDGDSVTFSAISGPPPVGCDGGLIEYPYNYREAITASGGLILSACETDWTDHWQKLAAHTMNGQAFFTLEGAVLPASIQVYVNDQRATGWSWDEGFNAVTFEEGSYPQAGSDVRITYIMGGSCE